MTSRDRGAREQDPRSTTPAAPARRGQGRLELRTDDRHGRATRRSVHARPPARSGNLRHDLARPRFVVHEGPPALSCETSRRACKEAGPSVRGQQRSSTPARRSISSTSASTSAGPRSPRTLPSTSSSHAAARIAWAPPTFRGSRVRIDSLSGTASGVRRKPCQRRRQQSGPARGRGAEASLAPSLADSSVAQMSWGGPLGRRFAWRSDRAADRFHLH